MTRPKKDSHNPNIIFQQLNKLTNAAGLPLVQVSTPHEIKVQIVPKTTITPGKFKPHPTTPTRGLPISNYPASDLIFLSREKTALKISKCFVSAISVIRLWTGNFLNYAPLSQGLAFLIFEIPSKIRKFAKLDKNTNVILC